MMRTWLSPLGLLDVLSFYQKDLTQPLVEIRAKVDVTIGQATESDIDELAALVKRRYGPGKNMDWYSKQGIRDTILQRFRRGCKCFVGRIGTEIVHYNWIFFHWEETDPGAGFFTRLKEDEALCNDAFTVEGWRGRAIHTVSNSKMCLFLKQAGYRMAYTVGGSNQSSLKTLHRVGWVHSGTMLYFIPRGAEKAWIWRINGALDPFVEQRTPAREA